MSWQILEGDVRTRLAELDDESAQTVVTSPPYWGLRDYGNEGQLGLEPTPEEYVANMVAVFREVRRVLRDDGTLWLNLGDSYAGSGKGPSNSYDRPAQNMSNVVSAPNRWLSVPAGVKAKDLLMIPALVALGLRADGWYLRDEIIWHKPAPMPTSAGDRTCRAHEAIYMFAKSRRYHYDQQAIAEPSVSDHDSGNGYARPEQLARGGRGQSDAWRAEDNPTRIKRSVWTVGTANYPDAHFATFPPKLIEPCILAGARPGDTVLDPFAGSGTTGLVALRHERSFAGIELNSDYCELARNRIRDDAPLLNAQLEAA